MLKVYNKMFSISIYEFFIQTIQPIMTSPITYIYRHLYSVFLKNQIILISMWIISLPFIMYLHNLSIIKRKILQKCSGNVYYTEVSQLYGVTTHHTRTHTPPHSPPIPTPHPHPYPTYTHPLSSFICMIRMIQNHKFFTVRNKTLHTYY